MNYFLLLFFFSLYFFPCQSSAAFCDNYQPPKIYTKIKDKADEKIRIFANKEGIARRADETLSKLITAKSPIIASWLGKRGLNFKSEDEIVREWRNYFARNFILTKYPQGDKKIDKDIETLMGEINKLFASKLFKEKLENLFERSKKQSLAVVGSFPISDKQKKQIASRIQSIRLYWMKDFKTSKFTRLPMEFLDWGIAYDPIANEINVGINSLSYPNDETYMAVFSHEIGHSFDSCRWGAYFNGNWPFDKIGKCLRASKSVAAKKRDDRKIEDLAKANAELASSLKQNPTCNKLGYPPAGLQADQLPESFADWFSAESMATITDLKPSLLRNDLCEAKTLIEGSSYPTNELRLKAIYFAHPKLKAALQQPEQNPYQYCGW